MRVQFTAVRKKVASALRSQRWVKAAHHSTVAAFVFVSASAAITALIGSQLPNGLRLLAFIVAAIAATIGGIMNWYGKKPKDLADNAKTFYERIHSEHPYAPMTTTLVLSVVGVVCTFWIAVALHGAWIDRQRAKSLPNMDGGTWIHVHPQNGTGFNKCTTAFTVKVGSAKYMVTARTCLPAGRSTITTSDDATGRHDAIPLRKISTVPEPEVDV